MNLIELNALTEAHKAKLLASEAKHDETIAHLDRMAREAIASLDDRHKSDCAVTAQMFDTLISREKDALSEIRAELGIGPIGEDS